MHKLNSRIDRIEEFLSSNDKKMGSRKKEIKSNITDNDSATMKTSHGYIQGYNAQALVDDKHQIVVVAQAMSSGQDGALLEPMLELANKNLAQVARTDSFLDGKEVLADTGYFSIENLEEAQRFNTNLYIPDKKFRKRDERFATKSRHVKSKAKKFMGKDFTYDEHEDVVVCPAGIKLLPSKGSNTGT